MNKRDAIVAGLLAAILMALLGPFASLGVDAQHDGIMLKPALDVLSGQVLFRDTFMQYGALTCYLQVLAVWIHPSLLALRFMMVAAYGLTLFFLYASWRFILPRPLAILSCGLFILFIPGYEKNWLDQYWTLLPWSSVFAMLFQSIGLYALFQIIRDEQAQRWAVVLGLTCACVFWCRQPVGVTMFGALAGIWILLHRARWTPARHSKWSVLGGFCAGFVAVNAILLASVVLTGALPEWWYQNFVWPRKWVVESANGNAGGVFRFFVHPAAGAALLLLFAAAAGSKLIKRFRPNTSRVSLGVYLLCLGGILIWQREKVLQILALREGGWSALLPMIILLQAAVSVILIVVARDRPKNLQFHLIMALGVLSVSSLLQYYPFADPWHVVWSLAPAFGLFTFVFWHWVGWSVPVVTIGLVAAFLPALLWKFASARRALDRPLVTLVDPPMLRGMRVAPEEARTIGQITTCLAPVLRHQPDIPSVLMGNEALFLCFTNNRTNPSPYYVTWIGLADNEANQKRWDYIQKVRPLMFLHKAKWDAVNDFYRRSRYVPLLYIPEEALEIAVPQELADRMGVTTYGAALKGGAKPAPVKP